MIDWKKYLTGRTLQSGLDYIVRWLGFLHQMIAKGFLSLCRMIGKAFSLVPWGVRYAVLFAAAGLLVFWLWCGGSSLFLLNGLTSLESYADRNANRISLGKTDYGINLNCRLYNTPADRLALIKKLEALLSEAENGEHATEEQFALVSEITGVDASYMEGAEKVLCKDHQEQIRIEMRIEKVTGATEDHTVTLVNPTPEQHALVKELSVSERFRQALADQLYTLITAENRAEGGARGTKVTEVTAVKFTHTPAFQQISVINMQPMEMTDIEAIEDTFDAENTTHISAFSQYAAFRNAGTAQIVQNQIDAQNEKLRQLTELENEKEKESLAQQADAAVLSYKASHGRIRKDEEKAIRENFAKKYVEKKPVLVEKKSIKGSQISDWYQEEFVKTKFNQDNLRFDPSLLEIMYENGVTKAVETYTGMPALLLLCLLAAGIVLAAMSAAVPLAIIRKIAYYVLLAGAAAFTVYWLWLISLMFDIPGSLMAAAPDKNIFDSDARNDIWFDYLWFWMPGAFFSFFLWFPLLLSPVKEYFRVKVAKREIGDVMKDSLLCKTEAGGIFSSFYWVCSYHFVILLVLPLLLHACYEEDEYSIPKGDGGGQVQQVQQVKKIKKKKIKKRFVLNPNSAFLFTVPEMPDDLLLQEFDEQTESTYVTTGGTIGGGKKGGKPGWPNGMDDGVIRFIRLKYNGGDWDQDMGKGSDYNMLLKMKEFAGFNIAANTEEIVADELENRFRNKKKKPPFIYITGSKGINLTNKEVKQLRTYLLEDGGMLFADNGGGHFDRSFRNIIRRILPNHSLVDIANDDIIYQKPFHFPNGAPRLFHHSGDRALGVKNNGRWIVFYHQGDINDAWKAGGSGLSEQQQLQAFWLGANVIAYAFEAYLNTVYGEM